MNQGAQHELIQKVVSDTNQHGKKCRTYLTPVRSEVIIFNSQKETFQEKKESVGEFKEQENMKKEPTQKHLTEASGSPAKLLETF